MKMFVGEAFLRQQTVITNLIYIKFFFLFFHRKAKYVDHYFVTCEKLC